MVKLCFFNLLGIFSIIVLCYFLLTETNKFPEKKQGNHSQPENVTQEKKATLAALHNEIAASKLILSELKFRFKQLEEEQRSTTPLKYEKTRQDLERDLRELKYVIRGFFHAANFDAETSQFETIKDIHRQVTSHVWKLPNQDGYQKLRQKEISELTRIVQKRIQALQNPADCSTVKKLVCSVKQGNIDYRA